MTLVRCVWLVCDNGEAHKQFQPPPQPSLLEEATDQQVRADGVKQGWHRGIIGDICPECWKDGVR
jgi:hypothetical protein